MKKLFSSLFSTGRITGMRPANFRRYNKPILKVVHDMTIAIEHCNNNKELNNVVKMIHKEFMLPFVHHVSYAHYLAELSGRIQGKRYELNINDIFS